MPMAQVARGDSYWGGGAGAGLATLLAILRATYQIHQASHWQARGVSYYGDHLLFQRLYEDIVEEIDGVAERVVGSAGIPYVDPTTQAAQTAAYVAAMRGDRVVTSTTDLAAIGLAAETVVLAQVDELMQTKLPHGTQNLLQGIADKHETHRYLLQQRLAQG